MQMKQPNHYAIAGYSDKTLSLISSFSKDKNALETLVNQVKWLKNP